MEEERIEITNTISIADQRNLLEITNNMVRAINEEEYVAILAIYHNAISRLLYKGELNYED